MNAARSMILECIILYYAVGRLSSVPWSVLYHFVIRYITLVKYVLEKLVVCCTIFSRFQEGQFDL